jgi:hypothetical protein
MAAPVTANDIFQAIESGWAIILTVFTIIASIITFSVKYNTTKTDMEKRILSAENRILSLESQFVDIGKSLVRIETILLFNQKHQDALDQAQLFRDDRERNAIKQQELSTDIKRNDLEMKIAEHKE